MKMPELSLMEWQKRYGTEKAFADAIAKYRWPQGFICPRCNSDAAWYITTRAGTCKKQPYWLYAAKKETSLLRQICYKK